jgi:hypothetical protein
MDRSSRRWCLAMLVLISVLVAACSGSGNSPEPTPPPVLPVAADDTFTALTARDQLLDVLANDRDPAGGALTLVAVTGQGQAALAIDGNRVRYRPRCCDLTGDEFRYTVRNAAGGTATAVVRTTIERRLMLRGTVADLGSSYALRLFDASNSSEARRESVPDFAYDLPLRADTALLRLEARRIDASGTTSDRDVLQSVLGDGPELARRAGADGELTANEWDALRVSSLTTAWLGVLRELDGGAIPIDSARWSALLARSVDVEDVLARAHLVKAALDEPSLTLPTLDTFALASSSTHSAALLATMPADFSTRDRAPLFGPASRSPFPTPAPPTLWLYRGGFAQDEIATRLELASGGTGRAIGPEGATSISWSTSNGALSVTQAPPSSIPAAPELLVFGSTVLRGPICTVGNPVGRIEDRVSVLRLDLRALAFAADAGRPLRTVADYEGVALTGGSPSGCSPLFSPLTLRPGLGLIAAAQPGGVTLPEGPLSGAWVLPRCGPSCTTASPDARPLRAGRSSLDANRQGRGMFEEDSGVVAARVEGGVVRLSYSDGEAQAYPVAGVDGAYRVVAAFPTSNGVGVVSEGWLVQEDTSLRIADLWRGHTLRDCCRRGEVRDLSMGADGSFAGLNLAATHYELDGQRVVFELAATGPIGPRRVSFTALRRLADGRVLMLTRFDDDLSTELDDESPVVDLVRFE